MGVLGCLLILGGTLIFGTGCGSSEDTTAPPVKQVVASKDPSTPHAQIGRYMKQRFGSESWYPLIKRFQGSSGGSVVVVETGLTNHQTPRWNQEQAKVMCRAFLSSPVVTSANVLYDARTGYPVASCRS